MKINIVFFFVLIVSSIKAQFSSEVVLYTTPSTLTHFHVSDIDNSGSNDILYSDYNKIRWIKNYTGASYDTSKFIHDAPSSWNIIINSIDKDFDGDQDIILEYRYGGSIYWIENMGNDSFIFRYTLKASTHLSEYSLLKVADVNNDNLPDIVHSSITDLKTLFFLADPLGNYQLPLGVIHFTFGTSDFDIGYLDNDNRWDFITLKDNGELRHIEYTGTSFTSGSIPIDNSLTSNKHFFQTKLIDLEQDADLDIIASSEELKWIYYHKNINDSIAVDPITIDTNIEANRIILADVDYDGLEDIIATDYTSGKLVWYQNLGGLQFSSQIVISDSFSTPIDIKYEDWDMDGVKDLIAGSGQDHKLSWFKNNSLLPVSRENQINGNSTTLYIYPNPFKSELTISSNEILKRVDVYDGQGELVSTTFPEKKTTTIQASNLPIGIYFLNATFNDGAIISKKIVLSK